MLSTDQKGAIAEAAIALSAIKHGVAVAKPLRADERYDLVFDLGTKLLRVQCKWAVRTGDVIAARCYSSRRTANGFLKRAYLRSELDAIAAYCPDLDRCYFLALDRFPQRAAIQLRLARTRNNQKVGVVWASDFESAATLGAVAGP